MAVADSFVLCDSELGLTEGVITYPGMFELIHVLCRFVGTEKALLQWCSLRPFG